MSLRRLDSRVALAALAAILVPSCITPPVVAEAHNEHWTLESSRYPQDARLVEIVRGDEGPTLRGLFVPSDEGAPVVVHFAESAASLTSSLHLRGQYHALAELGLASLVVDYSGVGLSDGDTSPRRLGEDAFAIWNRALELVDGDASRLVLRGASLGTVASASLIARGIRPAAWIAFAPVRPETVAVRYGYAVFWDPLVWLAVPFLRTFIDADPLEWLAESSVPRLVVCGPDDELLGERDFERIKETVESTGGEVEVKENLFVMLIAGDEVMEAVQRHVALTHQSFFVRATEKSFLRSVFPDVPNVEQRLDRVRRLGTKAAVAAVWSDPSKVKRLEMLIADYRELDVSVALAAAMQLKEEELASFDDWVMKIFNGGLRDAFKGLSVADMASVFDLSDPGGRLPIDAIVAARAFLGKDVEPSGKRRWPEERLQALASAILGQTVPGQVFEEGGDKLVPGEDWRFSVVRDGQVSYAEFTPNGTRHGARSVTAFLRALESDTEGRSLQERERRLRRCILKAAGLPAK